MAKKQKQEKTKDSFIGIHKQVEYDLLSDNLPDFSNSARFTIKENTYFPIFVEKNMEYSDIKIIINFIKKGFIKYLPKIQNILGLGIKNITDLSIISNNIRTIKYLVELPYEFQRVLEKEYDGDEKLELYSEFFKECYFDFLIKKGMVIKLDNDYCIFITDKP